MAELTKKLQVKVSGTTTPCKIYSTSAEAGTSYVRAKVDNVEAYIPLVAASDGRASKVHIGSKCIATTGKPPYTEKSWTTAGTYTFTVPAGVTRIRVAVCGGGGGAGHVLGGANSSQTGGTGGTSSFGNLLSATGGTGGRADAAENDPDEQTGTAGKGGSPNGRDGTLTPAYGSSSSGKNTAGATGFALSFTMTNGSYGNGGGVQQNGNARVIFGATGGSGGYNSNYVNVQSGSTYTVQVGAGGAARNAVNNGVARAGNSGFVLIAFGGDI